MTHYREPDLSGGVPTDPRDLIPPPFRSLEALIAKARADYLAEQRPKNRLGSLLATPKSKSSSATIAGLLAMGCLGAALALLVAFLTLHVCAAEMGPTPHLKEFATYLVMPLPPLLLLSLVGLALCFWFSAGEGADREGAPVPVEPTLDAPLSPEVAANAQDVRFLLERGFREWRQFLSGCDLLGSTDALSPAVSLKERVAIVATAKRLSDLVAHGNWSHECALRKIRGKLTPDADLIAELSTEFAAHVKAVERALSASS